MQAPKSPTPLLTGNKCSHLPQHVSKITTALYACRACNLSRSHSHTYIVFVEAPAKG